METRAHLQLKMMAVAYLRGRGCAAVAEEVRCPISRYRADVAGYRDSPAASDGHLRGRQDYTAAHGRPRWRRPERTAPAAIVVECKQARSDFLRDRSMADSLLARRRELDRLRQAMEHKRIMVEEPHLRTGGSSLFPEMDEWNFADSRLPGYRDLIRKLRTLDRKLHGQTKFCMLGQYRLADELYIAAPRDMIRPCDLPPGWGLLECPRSALDRGGDLTVRVEAPSHTCKDQHRRRWLRNIAVAASLVAFGTRVQPTA